MTKLLSSVLADYGPGMVAFWCPGCDSNHPIRIAPKAGSPAWGFNGNFEAPTFTPSVLIRFGHHVTGQEGKTCWCDYNRKQVAADKEPARFTCGICHSFVTDGRIQFLGDCTHALANQTVDLPRWPVAQEA